MHRRCERTWRLRLQYRDWTWLFSGRPQVVVVRRVGIARCRLTVHIGKGNDALARKFGVHDDSALLLDRALRLTEGSIDPVRLNDALGKLGEIDTPRGSWAFNVERAPQQTWYLRRLRMDGQVAANLVDADLLVLS